MPEEKEVKHIAVRADGIFYTMIVVILLCAVSIIYQNHKWGDIERDLRDEIRDIKTEYGVLEGRVDWNEDQNVNTNTWKEKVYQEKILGGSNGEIKR